MMQTGGQTDLEAVEDKCLEHEARRALLDDERQFDYVTLEAWACRIYKIGFKRGAKSRETKAYHKTYEEQKILGGINVYVVCSNCGREQDRDWNYCPYCGARMVQKEEWEDARRNRKQSD